MSRGNVITKIEAGFSLVELMIVVAVLGILAAIVVPQFQEDSTLAKEAVAKDNLRMLRSTVELYAAQHGSVCPGYPNDDPTTVPTAEVFRNQTIVTRRYLLKVPRNPFNELDTMLVVGNGVAMPPVTGTSGWIYQPATGTVVLDWRGSDKEGTAYSAY